MTMHRSGQDEKMLFQADLAYSQHADDLTVWLSRLSKISHIQKTQGCALKCGGIACRWMPTQPNLAQQAKHSSKLPWADP